MANKKIPKQKSPAKRRLIKRRHIHLAIAVLFAGSVTGWPILEAPKDDVLVHQPMKAGDVQKYKQMSCAGLAKSGEEFDAIFTAYYKPVYGMTNGYDAPRHVASASATDLASPGEVAAGNAPGTNAPWAFFCAVGMNCACPNGYETSLRCYADVGTYSAAGRERGWYPCKPFGKTVPYCDAGPKNVIPNKTVAADDSCFPTDGTCQIRVDDVYDLTITDTGGAIQGRRFDLYTDVHSSPLFETGIHHVKMLNPEACSPASTATHNF